MINKRYHVIYVICRLGCPYSARDRRPRPRAAFSSPRSQTDPKKLIYFFKLKETHGKNHASVTVTVVRDRKVQTALRTNQIVGFVNVPSRKKIIMISNFECDGPRYRTSRNQEFI